MQTSVPAEIPLKSLAMTILIFKLIDVSQFMWFGTKTIWKIVNSLPQEKKKMILKKEKKKSHKRNPNSQRLLDDKDFTWNQEKVENTLQPISKAAITLIHMKIWKVLYCKETQSPHIGSALKIDVGLQVRHQMAAVKTLESDINLVKS